MDNAKQEQAQAAVKKPWSKPRLLIVEMFDTAGQPPQRATNFNTESYPLGAVYDPNLS